MSVLAYVIVFLFSLLFQLKIAPLFSINDIQPDFILVFVIVVALRNGPLWGTIAGCLAGVAWDLFGTEFVGVSALSKSVTGYVAGFVVQQRVERGFRILSVFLFVLLLIHNLLFFSIFYLGTAIDFWTLLTKHVLLTAIYTFIIALVVHLVWPSGLWGYARRYE